MTDQQPEVVDLFVVQFRIQGTGEWKAVGITGGIEGARAMGETPIPNPGSHGLSRCGRYAHRARTGHGGRMTAP